MNQLTIDRKIEELHERKQQLEKQLEITSHTSEQYRKIVGGDVYDTRTSTVYGYKDPKKAASIREEIAHIDQQIADLHRLAHEDHENLVKQGVKEDAEKEATAFRKAKARYQRKSVFERALIKIKGKAPKWDKLKNRLDSRLIDANDLDNMFTGKKK